MAESHGVGQLVQGRVGSRGVDRLETREGVWLVRAPSCSGARWVRSVGHARPFHRHIMV
jgi:hypothetical protein